MIRRLTVALATSSLLLTGCGDENDPSGPADFDEAFTITVQGDLTGSVTGAAYFGDDEMEGEPVFGIILDDATSSHSLILAVAGSERPDAGTYAVSIDGGADWIGLYLVEDDDVSGMVVGVDGTVTITRSTSDRITGTLQMSAEGLLAVEGGEPEEITVQIVASFDAKPAE